MSPELEDKLCRRFPILYQDRYEDPSTTCMCWGFPGDGWYEIIYMLSLAINEELGYEGFTGKIKARWYLFKKRFFKRWNALIYKYSPVVHDTRKMVGAGTKEDPYKWVVVEKAKPIRPWLKKLVRFPYTGVAVAQVKEKFGTLRFYSWGTDRIHNLIKLAERLSATTCEECGKYGKSRSGGWIQTLCDTHAEGRP